MNTMRSPVRILVMLFAISSRSLREWTQLAIVSLSGWIDDALSPDHSQGNVRYISTDICELIYYHWVALLSSKNIGFPTMLSQQQFKIRRWLTYTYIGMC